MNDYPIVKTGEGVTRQVLADHPDLMVVAFHFDKAGAEGALHDHPHVQSTYVKSGQFRFFLGGEEREVGPGDSFVVDSRMTHGCACVEPGTLVDCFTPRRERLPVMARRTGMACPRNNAARSRHEDPSTSLPGED